MEHAVDLPPEPRTRDDRNAAAVIRTYADLAHDLSNLLLAAQTSLELIGMRSSDAKLTALADRGLAALERAGGLVESLRPLTCRRVLAPVPADLAAVLREQTSALERLASPGVALHVAIDMVEAPVAAEAEQLVLMLENLVANARDALAAEGAIEIALRFRDASTAELTVTDHGTGMNAM